MLVTTGRLFSAYEQLWTQPSLSAVVQEFLVLMHQIVRASVPLMETARSLAVTHQGSDPVNRLLAPYLEAHIMEEQAHDTWVLEDLETAGLDRNAVCRRIPSASVASLVGAQYYWIHHHHPVSLVGYMRLLEAHPPSVAHIQRLQERSGLAPSVFRTYRLHGELDPHHSHEMDRFIDSLPLSRDQGHLIWISASHTAHALADCLEGLLRDS